MRTIEKLGGAKNISESAKALFAAERARKRLDGWFLCREIAMLHADEAKELPLSEMAAASGAITPWGRRRSPENRENARSLL